MKLNIILTGKKPSKIYIIEKIIMMKMKNIIHLFIQL